jgi:hypothetical protein
LKVIIYLGDIYVGAEVAAKAYEKELYGEDYAWLGGMWLTPEMIAYIEEEHSSDSDDIYEILNGAIGIADRGLAGDTGTKFGEAYQAAYGSEVTDVAMYTYDAVYMFATTIKTMISRGEDFNSG